MTARPGLASATHIHNQKNKQNLYKTNLFFSSLFFTTIYQSSIRACTTASVQAQAQFSRSAMKKKTEDVREQSARAVFMPYPPSPRMENRNVFAPPPPLPRETQSNLDVKRNPNSLKQTFRLINVRFSPSPREPPPLAPMSLGRAQKVQTLRLRRGFSLFRSGAAPCAQNIEFPSLSISLFFRILTSTSSFPMLQ